VRPLNFITYGQSQEIVKVPLSTNRQTKHNEDAEFSSVRPLIQIGRQLPEEYWHIFAYRLVRAMNDQDIGSLSLWGAEKKFKDALMKFWSRERLTKSTILFKPS
jgi:hypothetical protein